MPACTGTGSCFLCGRAPVSPDDGIGGPPLGDEDVSPPAAGLRFPERHAAAYLEDRCLNRDLIPGAGVGEEADVHVHGGVWRLPHLVQTTDGGDDTAEGLIH